MAKAKNDELEDLPPDEADEAPEPKAKAKVTGKAVAKKAPTAESEPPARPDKKKRPAADDDDTPPRRKKRGADLKVPYPPSPDDVPEGLTDYAESYIRQQNYLLAGLFLFLMFYIGAVLFFALVGFWCAWSLGHWLPLKVVGLVFSGVFFLYLVKGFFKSHPMDKEMHIEITGDEHPVLFAFIDQLCDELGAPKPNKVFVSPDVNAAVMPRTSLINLFIEPKKDLLIGLGLVNSVNLSEFKAVLAHEFGHFGQSATASSYTYVASRIIGDLVEGEDWFDRVVNWCKRQDNVLKIIGYTVGAPLWLGRKVLEQCYKLITLQRLAVSREREFHADLVAVSAAGSDAVVHCLLRTEFGHQCFMQALSDLSTALDHKLHSNDMYLHQDRAATVVRRKKKEPAFGLPPALKGPHEGKDVDVFDADEEAMEDEIPPMWRTHPRNSDRERNAKEQFVPAVVDHRSPWILFDRPEEIRERMTYKFYRMVFKAPKNVALADAVKVQKFIDNEHADTTYDPKYKGCYDDRPLEPGDLSELNGIIKDKPWTDERMEKVLEKLYDGCEVNVETRNDLYKDLEALRGSATGRPSPKLKRQIEEAEKKRDENWEWFKSFDRRVYILHVQMATQVAPELKDELVERYRFQLEVQRLYMESRQAYDEADRYLTAHSHMQQQLGDQMPGEFIGEVLRVLRTSWKSLKNIIRDAKEINLPAMKNFEEGENLADFILEGKMVPEPPLSYAKGAWINKLMQQLHGVRMKCFRLHFKSVGGVLRMQEEIAAKWKAAREPISAEVVEVETVEAEVIPAEVVPAEVVEAEVIEAEVLPDAPPAPRSAVPPSVPPAPVPTPVVAAPPAPEPVPVTAAFVAPQPAPVTTKPERGVEAPPAPVASGPILDMSALAAVAAPAMVFVPDPPVGPPVPAADVFTLDSEPEPAPAAVVAKAPEPPPAPAASGGLFSLDADELKARPTAPQEVADVVDVVDVVEVVDVIEEPAAPKPAEPALSGITDVPKPRTAAPVVNLSLDGDADLGFPNAPATPGLKPAAGARPAVRITLVRPGERSPLAK